MNMSNVAGKKVVVISETYNQDLESKINEFLSEHKQVWNIQYQMSGTRSQGFRYSALIIYDN